MEKLKIVYFTDLFTGAVKKSMLLPQKEKLIIKNSIASCVSFIGYFSLTSAYA